MISLLGDTEEGVSGLEEDELNLETFMVENEVEVKSSYEKTYLKVIAELSDLTVDKNKITSE
jgi:hypothetical protein